MINIAYCFLRWQFTQLSAKLYRILPTYLFNWIVSIFEVTGVNTHHLFVLSLCDFMDTHFEWFCKCDLVRIIILTHRERTSGNQLELHANGVP